MTLHDKHIMRNRLVYIAFAFMVIVPIASIGLLLLGISPAPAASIFATASATFGAIIIGHFATSPKDK
jgi:hypothetical protein